MLTTIETIDEWKEIRNTLLEFDYHLWQCQFGTHSPEGFIATFTGPAGSELSVATHSEQIYQAIIHFCTGKSSY